MRPVDVGASALIRGPALPGMRLERITMPTTIPDRVPLVWLAHALDRPAPSIRSAVCRGTFPILPTRVLGRLYFERDDVDALLRGEFDRQPARERAARRAAGEGQK